MTRLHGLFAIALMGVVTSATVDARADKALLVGVNEYPKLARGSNLEGCVNDTRSMEKTLVGRGFTVTTLINEQASKRGILDALARMKTEARGNERFVFYFAGHGVVASDGSSALLPGDASEKTEASDLLRDELYNALMAVPASSRTVLLDSCFSGGLSRRSLGRKIKKTRFYKRGSAANNGNNADGNNGKDGRRTIMEMQSDSNDHIAKGAEIVYFTASLANQTSGEDDFAGERGGVFTHFLTTRLQKITPQTLWNEVQKDVTGEVADYMEQTQTPKLSPTDYASRPVFDGKDAPAPTPDPAPNPEPKRTVWDDFNQDHTDTSLFALTMTPGLGTIKVKQTFTFEAKVGPQSGWLVLLEKDTDGKVYLLFPANHSMEAARVSANSTLRLPVTSGRSYAADTPGVERVKALLFTDEANASALIKAFPQEGAEPRKMKRIVEMETQRQPYYTFGLTFGVE